MFEKILALDIKIPPEKIIPKLGLKIIELDKGPWLKIGWRPEPGSFRFTTSVTQEMSNPDTNSMGPEEMIEEFNSQLARATDQQNRVELGRDAYYKGLKLDSSDLKGWATQVLINALGNAHRAARIEENIRIAFELESRKKT